MHAEDGLTTRVSVPVRLLTGIHSAQARPGDAVRAVVTAPVRREGATVLPAGALLTGEVEQVFRVGLGLVRERARLRLKFTQLRMPDAGILPMEGRVSVVENARESVNDSGEIKGILSAGGAPGFLMGMWHRPAVGMFARASLGLVGVTHFAGRGLGLHPIGGAGLTAFRLAAVPFPEPEIVLPAGTDLIVSALMVLPPPQTAVPAVPATQAVTELVSRQPFVSAYAGSGKEADPINMMFFGSREQLAQAFQLMGWLPADPLTPRSMLKAFRSLSSQSAYPTAPVSRLLLQGESADLVFQKSLNTMSKRHHIRIWQSKETWDGQAVWLAAATHDVAIEIRSGSLNFTHKIDPEIDRERTKVADDLIFAGCAAPPVLVPRPPAAGNSLRGLVSDGRIAVLQMTECEARGQQVEPKSSAGFTWRGRLLRRVVLESRHTILRGNVYYWGVQSVRHGWRRSREWARARSARETLKAAQEPPRAAGLPVGQ